MAKEEKGTGAETAAEPAVPVHETIEHWYNVHGTGPAVYAGTLCLKGWRPGKQVTCLLYTSTWTVSWRRGAMTA